ncbi:MAG TPA: hypothetical protein VMY18_00895 [Acidobacteriota bacterium]|nr:hypothetical protein [Acidobacteriota bacterium]
MVDPRSVTYVLTTPRHPASGIRQRATDSIAAGQFLELAQFGV